MYSWNQEITEWVGLKYKTIVKCVITDLYYASLQPSVTLPVLQSEMCI